MLTLPAGVYPGSWISGVEYADPWGEGGSAYPMGVYRSRPDLGSKYQLSVLRGGDTSRAYESTTPTFDVFETQSQVSGRGPGGLYSAAWSGKVSVLQPLRKGIGIYLPETEMNTTVGAVGWQHENGDIYLDSSRSSSQGGSTFFNTVYIPWANGPGEDEWNLYSGYLAWEEPIQGTWEIPVTGTISPAQGWGDTFGLGPLAPYTYTTSSSTSSNPNTERVRASDVPVTVGGYTFSNPNGVSQTLSLSLASLPTMSFESYGPAVILAIQVSDLPPPYGLLAPGQFDSGSATVNPPLTWNNVLAISRPFRLLYSTPRITAGIPLRQNRRTDGLLGSGRQGRTSLRQGRVSGPATI